MRPGSRNGGGPVRDPRVDAALALLLDEPAPASTVDLARAAESGRRIRRRRTTLSTMAASAATVLTVVAVGALAWTVPGGQHSAAASGSDPSVGPAPQTSLVLAGTDPVRLTARFGWLPPSAVVTDRSWSTGSDEQTATVGTDLSGASIDLTVSYGAEPPLGDLPGAIPATRIPAADVNGYHAYWLTRPRAGAATPDQDVILRWQFGAKAWADLEIDRMTSAEDFTALIYRIAEGVTYGHSDPVALPIHIASLPAGLTVGTGQSTVSPLEYTTDPQHPGYVWQAVIGGSGPANGTWQIKVQPYLKSLVAAEGAAMAGVMALTVDGHPAELTATGLVVYDVDGLTVSISATRTALESVKAIGGYSAFFDRLTLLGTNQANWTTQVVG